MPDPQVSGLVCVDCGVKVRRCHAYHPQDPSGTECYVHLRPTDHDPVPVPMCAYLPPLADWIEPGGIWHYH
jgi:hypothetical protein